MVGIEEIASTVSLAKEGISLFNYFRKTGIKYFSRKSFPLDKFRKQEVVIIGSSLLAHHNDKSKNYYSLVKPMKDKNGEWKDVPIGSGFNVTGIYDAFGLTKLSIALIQRNSLISLGIDSIDEKLKKEHLCLMGGKSSNLVARELYYDYLPSKFQFYGKEGGLDIHGKNFKSGGYGHILSMENPWNKNKRVIWLAGLGHLGTGAAVDFIIMLIDLAHLI